MNIILDLAVAAVILISVFLSAKRGFVNAVVEVVGFIAALILAFTLSTPIATFTYDKVIEPVVVDTLTESVQNIADASADNLLGTLPEVITENAPNFGISVENILGDVSGTVSENFDTAVATISQEIVKPITIKLLGMALAVIIFLLLSVLVKILARVLNKLFSFSIIGKVNTTLGGVVGLLKGIVIAAVMCVAISLIVNLSGEGFWIFTPDNIEGTYLFKYFAELTKFISI